MDIQWFPGHMTKTMRMMKEEIKLTDLLIELTDARIPLAGRNPDIDSVAAGKARVVILGKSDLADPAESRKWLEYFRGRGAACILADLRKKSDLKQVISLIEGVCEEKRAADAKKGMKERPIRAMVAGIPNVGKSTFINSLASRAMAKTGNKPGVTRGKQWIRLSNKLELLDTPGVLWPKFEDEKKNGPSRLTIGERLALVGSISDGVLDKDELALVLIGFLENEYPNALPERYGEISAEARTGDGVLMASPEYAHAYAVLEAIGKSRGFVTKGGGTDLSRTAGMLIDEFRSGKLGRITIEKAP